MPENRINQIVDHNKMNAQERLDKIAQSLNLDIPTSVVPLPSLGKIYAKDTPLANLKEVQIKCMTAREEDLLSSYPLWENGTALTELLKSTILTPGVASYVEQMISGDRNAILVALRITGYGDIYDTNVLCPNKKCNKESRRPLSLKKLKIKDLVDEPLYVNSNQFAFELPLSKKKVIFKLLTGKDNLEIEQDLQAIEKVSPSPISQALSMRLKKAILSIDDITDRTTLSSMVDYMAARDSSALRKEIERIQPDIEMRSKMICPHCNKESEVDIPLGIGFFWPELESRD